MSGQNFSQQSDHKNWVRNAVASLFFTQFFRPVYTKFTWCTELEDLNRLWGVSEVSALQSYRVFRPSAPLTLCFFGTGALVHNQN